MFELMRRTGLLVLAIIAFAGLSGAAHGYEVSPMRVFLDPAKGSRAATIAINNVRDEDLFIEIKTFRRIVQQDGTQTLEPVDDRFVIFPPQRKIDPKSSQAVRIQFAGTAPIDQSESYVVQVVEVPVEVPGFSGVRFTYNFGVAVYVDAPNAQARLNTLAGSASEGKLAFSVRNDGDAYGFTTGHALRYTINGQAQTIEPGALAELISMPIIPPNSQRDFVLEIPDLVAGAVTDIALLDRTS